MIAKLIFDMNTKQKKMLLRIILAAVMMILLELLPIYGIPRMVLYLIPYFVVGYDILFKAVRGIGNGQLLDENFLMAIATVGAIVLGAIQTGDYVEAVAVMLFYQIGELFQSYAVGKSRKNIAALMDIRPDFAQVEENGEILQVDPEKVPIGAVIVVDPGQRIPLDGIVLEGSSSLNMAALTGESLPRDVMPGDLCYSGCINLSGVLKICTTRIYEESTVARILDLVESAGANKSRSEKFISRFARIYTPAVCICAVMLAVVPPLWDGLWLQWLYRALTFLVASCPCALVISIPLTFFAGIGGAGKAGVLIKGSNYLEALAKTKTVVFDKTGTLTKGEFAVADLYSEKISEDELLRYAAMAESASTHPISKSLQRAFGKELDRSRVTDIQEHSGRGVTAVVDGVTVAAGNDKLMAELGISHLPCEEAGTVVYIGINGVYAGYILIRDSAKPNAAAAIDKLQKAGIRECVMLTGDSHRAAQHIAKELGIQKFYSELLPADKVTAVEQLLAEKPRGSVLAFVGDGINDAPVLTRADLGIAMGAMGSDAAVEAADIVLMDDDPEKIEKAMTISRKCMNIVYQNIVMAIGIKIAALILVAIGLSGMGLAIFADVGVMVLAVLNAIRALRIR